MKRASRSTANYQRAMSHAWAWGEDTRIPLPHRTVVARVKGLRQRNQKESRGFVPNWESVRSSPQKRRVTLRDRADQDCECNGLLPPTTDRFRVRVERDC